MLIEQERRAQLNLTIRSEVRAVRVDLGAAHTVCHSGQTTLLVEIDRSEVARIIMTQVIDQHHCAVLQANESDK